jgi:RNA polymerase sigma-70 factor (family 1)
MTDKLEKQSNNIETQLLILNKGANNSKILDSEIFIRQSFNENPSKGYELLFRKYYRALCSHAVRFVYSKETAEDIVGDVFLVLWKNKVHEQINTSFRAYLYVAVRNRAINYLQWEFKKDTDIDTIHENNLNQVHDDTPQTILQYDELFQKIETGIKALPPQCQSVFLMSRFENRKNREIAIELGIALKTVEAHIMKALAQMRKSLDGY